MHRDDLWEFGESAEDNSLNDISMGEVDVLQNQLDETVYENIEYLDNDIESMDNCTDDCNDVDTVVNLAKDSDNPKRNAIQIRDSIKQISISEYISPPLGIVLISGPTTTFYLMF